MSRKSSLTLKSLTILLLCFVGSQSTLAQTSQWKRQLITQRIDEDNPVTLRGNIRPEVQPANDRGPASGDLALEHMYLLLKRSPEQQQQLDDLINRLHDQNSPEFHRWLSLGQIEERFGPAEEDISTVTGWLESHGFSVNVVYRANGVIDFSGPANSIREAFHTEIHNLDFKGERHIANASDPQIPAALAPAVHGVVSMNDFRPRPLPRPSPAYTVGNGIYLVTPGDAATIYNMNPLFERGISGQGQTVVVVESSDAYNTGDWYTFRQTFGLAQRFPKGSFTQIHPQPSSSPNNGGPCADPGVSKFDGEAGEAILDPEWATAGAPSAAIVAASCADTNTNLGFLIAMQNLVTGSAPPPSIISMSVALRETTVGASFNAYISALYELSVLRGVSVFVAAGDGGAAGCDMIGAAAAEEGICMSALSSTPHNVAVGGTDFGDYYLGQSTTYWSATNGPYYNSALSYVPEIPWNQSCASSLLASFVGYPTSYGAFGFCNSLFGELFLSIFAGGGGPSGCAFGAPSIPGVVSGTCSGYAKPIYQRFVSGNPNDGVRDLPDVALFAALGPWGHAYSGCDSQLRPCVGPPANWGAAGGTSLASPLMAGIQALVNQAAGGRQGNPNFIYYALAAFEYDFGGGATCNATLGNHVDSRCIFHDITLGDNDVNCLPLANNGTVIGTFNCYIPSGTYGVLSLSNSSYQPAFPAAPGWDFATGLGSVNAYNLAKHWPGSRLH